MLDNCRPYKVYRSSTGALVGQFADPIQAMAYAAQCHLDTDSTVHFEKYELKLKWLTGTSVTAKDRQISETAEGPNQ